MGRVTNDLLGYYQHLAETMKRLAKQYPAMRLDAPAMSEMEAARPSGQTRQGLRAGRWQDRRTSSARRY